MQPSTGLDHELLKAQSWQLVLPLVLKVRVSPELVPTVPCLVHMFALVNPLLKLSRVPPEGIDRVDCTNSALPNRLSDTASALITRLTPRGSVPVDARCHTDADESRVAV